MDVLVSVLVDCCTSTSKTLTRWLDQPSGRPYRVRRASVHQVYFLNYSNLRSCTSNNSHEEATDCFQFLLFPEAITMELALGFLPCGYLVSRGAG